MLQADILHYNHNCDVVIMIHRKHGNGDTVMFYGTEGGGVSFIGNKSDMKTSEGGEVAVKLFQKFVQGEVYSVQCMMSIVSIINSCLQMKKFILQNCF